MSETQYTWQTLPNPFLHTDANNKITSHVTGRNSDIAAILNLNAVLLTGSPRIGKTVLLRYLQTPPQATWSWREEGSFLLMKNVLALDDLYFLSIDFNSLENATNVSEFPHLFANACINILSQVDSSFQQEQAEGIKSLRALLRRSRATNSKVCYYFILDNIDRIHQLSATPGSQIYTASQNTQDRGLALLDQSGIIRLLVDLLDEFENMRVILSINSLPQPGTLHQFTHISPHLSSDLARFTTYTLQIFPMPEAIAYIAQEPESFGHAWAEAFQSLKEQEIFSSAEQQWILEQAGSHPHLLQQFCYHTFNAKQNIAIANNNWQNLEESVKIQIVELINSRISTFLTHLWQRLQEALEQLDEEIKNRFFDFVSLSAHHQTTDIISDEKRDWLGAELRYILSNEGILRIEPAQPTYYPGAILRHFLQQKTKINNPVITRGFWLTIAPPGKNPERTALSELEYHLLKTLLQYPNYCSETLLIQNAWGKSIEKATFTQRMHHLRKKLRNISHDVDLITNHYGGQYSLKHSEWLHLE